MVGVIFWNLRYIARDFFDLGTDVFVPMFWKTWLVEDPLEKKIKFL